MPSTTFEALRRRAERVPGIVSLVEAIPPCDFCGSEGIGEFDFAVRGGGWAHGCERHFEELSASNGRLGVGHGQLWVLRPKVSA
jgi:hypothetical protein